MLKLPECFGQQDASVSEGFPGDCSKCTVSKKCQEETFARLDEEKEAEEEPWAEGWRFTNSRGQSVFKER